MDLDPIPLPSGVKHGGLPRGALKGVAMSNVEWLFRNKNTGMAAESAGSVLMALVGCLEHNVQHEIYPTNRFFVGHGKNKKNHNR